MSRKKQLWRCLECQIDTVLPFTASKPDCPKCEGETTPMLKPLIKDGKIVAKLPKPYEIRQYVLRQLEGLSL